MATPDFKKKVSEFANEYSGELKNIHLFKIGERNISIEKNHLCDGGRYFCLIIDNQKILFLIDNFDFININNEKNIKVIANTISTIETFNGKFTDGYLMVNN